MRGFALHSDVGFVLGGCGCRSDFVPKYALVNFLSQGKVPEELLDMTRVEESLISICCPLMQLAVIPTSGYSTLKRFYATVLNDLVGVMDQLPRRLTADVVCLVRAAVSAHRPPGGASRTPTPRDLTFRPLKIMKALRWLKANNPEYRDVEIHADFFGIGVDADSNEVHDVPPTVELDEEEDAELVDALKHVSAATISANPDSPGVDAERLLLKPMDSTSREDFITDHLMAHAETPSAVPTVVRASPKEFAHPFADRMFYQKCFPTKYPYAAGGPNGRGRLTDVDDFFKEMLMRGGDRRHQRSPVVIFTHYAYKMQRKVGGMVSAVVKASATGAVDVGSNLVRNLQGETDSDSDDTPDLAGDASDESDNDEDGGDEAHNDDIDKELTVNNVRQTILAARETGSSMRNIGPRASMSNPVVRKMFARMLPFARSIPGTPLHIKNERNKLLSIISSHTVKSEGHVAWFCSFASAEPFHDDLFRIVEGKNNPIFEGCREEHRAEVLRVVELYTKAERTRTLGEHPALAVRLYQLKMEGLWKYVIQGEHKPCGEVMDIWRRIEFQMRKVAHEHALIFVKKEMSLRLMGTIHEGEPDLPAQLGDEDPEVQRAVRGWAERTITCNLLPRLPDDVSDLVAGEDVACAQRREAEPDWAPERNEYFSDLRTNPCRLPFSAYSRDISAANPSAELDFGLNADLTPRDPRVHVRKRRGSLISNIHGCTFTCWKYNKIPMDRTCRFESDKWGTPLHMHLDATIVKDRDRRNRVRVRVLPPRNNAHMNNTFVSPLIPFATNLANHDVKMVDNEHGAAEYCCSYVSKPEAPDETVFTNVLTKKFARMEVEGDFSVASEMKAVVSSLLASIEVGLPQACMTLLNLPFVHSSRDTVKVNTLPAERVIRRIVVDMAELDGMDPDASAVDVTPTTQLGRRLAYAALARQQDAVYEHGNCEVTFYHILTHYRMTKPRKPPVRARISGSSSDEEDETEGGADRPGGRRPEMENKFPLTTLLGMTEDGSPDGFGPSKFFLPDVGVLFTRISKALVVQLSPYIPTNEADERFCFSMLLLHTPWPGGGERHLLGEGTEASPTRTAVDVFERRKPTLHRYVLRTLDANRRSENIMANMGQPVGGADDADEVDSLEQLGEDAAGFDEMDMDEAGARPVDHELENVELADDDSPHVLPIDSSRVRVNLSLMDEARCARFMQQALREKMATVRSIYILRTTNPNTNK